MWEMGMSGTTIRSDQNAFKQAKRCVKSTRSPLRPKHWAGLGSSDMHVIYNSYSGYKHQCCADYIYLGLRVWEQVWGCGRRRRAPSNLSSPMVSTSPGFSASLHRSIRYRFQSERSNAQNKP